MNAKRSKILRAIARTMVTNTNGINETQFFVQKNEDGVVEQTLIPMPVEWPKGTFRQIYQALK